MTNDIVVSELDLPISNIPQEALAKLTERNFLPFVKLVGTSSKEAEDSSVRPGRYILQKDNSNKLDLTESFEALVIASRPLACRKTMTTTLRYYDMASQEYQKIEKESAGPGLTGCWHGPEFLLWVRSQRTWVGFHASNETARSRSNELMTILTNWADARRAKKAAIGAAAGNDEALAAANAIVVPNPQVTFKCALTYYQAVRKNQWAPIFSPCTTPFSDVPAFEDVRAQTLKFISPPKSEQETVQAGAGAATETRG